MSIQQFGQATLPFGAVGNDVHEHIEHGCLGIECIVAPQLFLIRLHDGRLDTELPVPESGMMGAEVTQIGEGVEP